MNIKIEIIFFKLIFLNVMNVISNQKVIFKDSLEKKLRVGYLAVSSSHEYSFLGHSKNLYHQVQV